MSSLYEDACYRIYTEKSELDSIYESPSEIESPLGKWTLKTLIASSWSYEPVSMRSTVVNLPTYLRYSWYSLNVFFETAACWAKFSKKF